MIRRIERRPSRRERDSRVIPRVRFDRKLRELRCHGPHGHLRALEPLHRAARVEPLLLRDPADCAKKTRKVHPVVPRGTRPGEGNHLSAALESDVKHARVPRAERPPPKVHELRVRRRVWREPALGARRAEPFKHVCDGGEIFRVHRLLVDDDGSVHEREGTLGGWVPQRRSQVPADVGERHLVVELVVLDDVALLFTERTQPGFHPDGGGVEVEVVEPSGLPEDDREVLEARETPVPDVDAPEARARAFDRLAPVRRAEDRPGATCHVGSGQTGGRQVVDVGFKRVSPERLPRIAPKPCTGAVILGR